MHLTFKTISLVAASFLWVGCGSGSGGYEDSSNSGSSNNENATVKNVTIIDDIQVESLGLGNDVRAKINIGDTPKDLYILLSNYSKTRSESPAITHNQKRVSESKAKTVSSSDMSFQALHAPRVVQESNAIVKKLLKKNRTTSDRQVKIVETVTQRSRTIVGNAKNFYLDAEGKSTTIATARKVVSNVNTSLGRKTLSVWVSDDSFGSGCSKAKCVTQNMVDVLANTFLRNGADNDIYDWVTNIYGEEWESDAQAKHSELIDKSDEITILLTDIDKDNSATGGAIGFFWSKDNVKKASISGSNERIMFYADAVMFANVEGTWSIDDLWPKELVSTLVHEFQHMIHFYQKTVLLADEATDTWIDEMLAETTEDIIATKIRYHGPRAVRYTDGSAGSGHNTEGRYPMFNANNRLSLTSWSNTLANYSKVSAFGTYLVRNYGGAKLLHDIMHNSYVDQQAIVSAVHKSINGSDKTFNDLQREWGVAVLLSANENLEDLPSYNTGDFTFSSYKNSTYKMGSINFFNYSPLPKVSTSAGTVLKQGNYYYKIGKGLRGNITVDLNLDANTEATLIVQ